MHTKILIWAFLGLICSACSPILPRISDKTRYSRVGYSDLIEGKRTIYGTVTFKPVESGVGRQVVISTRSGHQVNARWEKSIAPNVMLEPNKEYRIEILTTISKKPEGISNEVLRVHSNDILLVDASVCYMHKIPMLRKIEDEVALEDYWPYRKQYFIGNNFTPKLFPNDGKSYLGCNVGPEWTTWQCQKCYQMSENWKRRNKIE